MSKRITIDLYRDELDAIKVLVADKVLQSRREYKRAAKVADMHGCKHFSGVINFYNGLTMVLREREKAWKKKLAEQAGGKQEIAI